MSNNSDMHNTGCKKIELPPYLKNVREQQGRLPQEKKDGDAAE